MRLRQAGLHEQLLCLVAPQSMLRLLLDSSTLEDLLRLHVRCRRLLSDHQKTSYHTQVVVVTRRWLTAMR